MRKKNLFYVIVAIFLLAGCKSETVSVVSNGEGAFEKAVNETAEMEPSQEKKQASIVSNEEGVFEEDVDEDSKTEPSQEKKEQISVTYPKIGDIEWSFVNGILYEEPAVFIKYKNNSNFSIVGLYFSFELREEISDEQMQLFDFLKEKWNLTTEEIAEINPEIYDHKVCDPGEEVIGASCDVYYNTPATDIVQCELLELRYVEINYIGEDNKLHEVAYSAENESYVLAGSSEELYEWSDSEYANMLPKPDTRIVAVDYDEDDYFQCTAYDMNSEAFKEYIEQCKEIGFNIDVEESDTSFWGTHSQGCTLHVRLFTYDAIEISLE